MTLVKQVVKEIGLYDPGSSGGLNGFSMGMTMESFHVSGSSPLSQELLNRLNSASFVSNG